MTSHEAFDFESFTGSENKYAILGVPQEASPEAIKKAFRRLAFLYHPDRHPGPDKQRAEDVFKRINAAYQTLADPVARRDYDRVLRRGSGASLEREPASGEIDPLAQILQEVLRYRQIFSSDRLKRFNEKLRSMVSENLISDLGEQIVGIIPLSAPPEPFELEGDFKSGSMVLTNLRILLPFWSRKRESWGATMATFDYYSMPGVAFAELRQVKLRSTSRIFRALSVHLECAEKTIVLQPKHRNLGKLLLLCSLWGIPVLAEEDVDKASDIVDAIVELPSYGIGLYIALNFFALVVGLFLDGPIATVAGLNTALWERGILQIAIVAMAAGMGVRIRSALRAYGRASVSDLLDGRES